MPELRKDPILGRWVIIATERAKRPKDFKRDIVNLPEGDCPFCRGNEHETSAELFSIRDDKGDWRVRVIPSRKPFLKSDDKLWKKGKGPYDLMAAFGSHETVIETPEHIANMADLEVAQIKDVLRVYCIRAGEIEKDLRIKYVLLF